MPAGASASTRPQPDRRQLAAVFAGGAAGALLRVAIVQEYPTRAGAWPWATLAINVTGALLVGLIISRDQPRSGRLARGSTSYARPLLATGFCGGFTTFSTMQLELLRMVDYGHLGLALTYALVSVVLGSAAVYAGLTLGGRAARDEQRHGAARPSGLEPAGEEA